ncbi:MAG: VCBS repeat-containing protein [Agriterribacter sp.]
MIKRLFCFQMLLAALSVNAQQAKTSTAVPTFKKVTLTTQFVSEGATAADVNKDGKPDVIAGAFWFEAPTWKRHEIAKGDTFDIKTYGNSFLNFAMDVNQDGWVDYIRVDHPGQPVVWFENPQNKPGHWKMHEINNSLGNESPMLVDVDGDGREDLIGNDAVAKQIIWLKSPTKKGDTTWKKIVVSADENLGTHKYTHGIGLGDINGDGRKDLIIKDGWFEAPVDRTQSNWTYHAGKISDDCSEMFVIDLNGDGLNDVISASAHDYGIWWHEQQRDANGNISWLTHEINKAFSETHGLELTDINGDGNPDLVTGKRFFAHNGGDPGGYEAAVLYWFEYKPGKTPQWIPHEIDNNSGVGLHVVVQDMNGDKVPDIVIGNKKGVYIFLQQRK